MRSFSCVFAFIVAAVGTTSLVAQQTLIQSQGQIIYYSGSSLGTTDGDLAPGMPSGERFGGGAQDNAIIAENGNVLFRGQMVSNTGMTLSPAYLQRAYFYGDSKGSLVSLMRGGDPEPSATIPNAILSTSSSAGGVTGAPRISGTGQIMFGASIWDFTSPSITSANDTVLYVGTPGNWQVLAREGDAAPGCGGALYTASFAGMSQQSTGINSAGNVLFQSSLGSPAVTATNAAWFTGTPGNVQLMLRKGDLALGGEQVSALGSISQMNALGQVLTDVTFLTGSGTTPVTNATDRALWIYLPGFGNQQLLREGDACTAIPGTNIANVSGSWGPGTGSTSFNDNAQFLLNTTLTGAVTSNVNDRAMLIVSLGNQTLVWRRGDLAPGAQVATPGATIDAATDASLCLNNAGRVAFEAFLFNGGTIAANDTGIFTGTPGNLTLIAREGDVAPGTGGLLFGQMTAQFMCMNGAGQVLFQNTLSDTLTSYWVWDPALGLQCLHRGNQPVEVQPGVFKTPATFGGVQFTNGNGRPLMFANDGTVVVKLSMTDGTSYGSQAMFKVRIGSLTGIPGKISEATGGAHTLYLNAGAAHAAQAYVVAGSASGTNPGTPIGAYVVPLNIDVYTDLTLQLANTGPFVNTFGTLNADGRATAAIVVPPAVPGLSGIVVHHAYGVLDAFNQLVFASEAARLEIIP